MIDRKAYKHKLECLKRNKEAVPLELLTTKYRLDYERLKQELKTMTEGLLREIALEGVKIRKDHAEETFQKINREIGESGLLLGISHAVYWEQDFDKLTKLAYQLRELIRLSE